ncbi:LOW QUALITY PROTEIN: hypothetical protein PHMEG_00037598 [Phytophthora megakarya]|uniref:Retrotransposon gag domain-containing protein n=1 Tax=Phytophthora megakarya TaxID=4795 RepID=A0A225UJG9_9STRA|nr:LOW QUALITY PROTEIN: hypothetical protein PHMEG_00037598 [Phytophthora megakarya]
MRDDLRLTAFEQCLKGKTGQEWWYNSRIENFRQLKDQFHNRFLSQTPAQIWNRLKSAKGNRDESAEEWGDRILRLCEALNYKEPRMQYEFFYDGIRNKKMRAVLNASMASSIEESMYSIALQERSLTEEDDEFAETTTLATLCLILALTVLSSSWILTTSSQMDAPCAPPAPRVRPFLRLLQSTFQPSVTLFRP